MNLVLLGAPGAGKGTQSQFIIDEFGLPHISTGDILRAAVKEGTRLGLKAKSYMDAGALVPDELIIDLMQERLGQEDCQKGFILDGFPRTTTQAAALDTVLSADGRRIDAAIAIEVPDEVIIERLSSRRVCRACGYTGSVTDATCPQCSGEMYQRADDNPETIKNRLDVYHTSTAPLVNYYGGAGVLVEIDGNRPVDQVYADVKAAIVND
jgi:adenylate kinase